MVLFLQVIACVAVVGSLFCLGKTVMLGRQNATLKQELRSFQDTHRLQETVKAEFSVSEKAHRMWGSFFLASLLLFVIIVETKVLVLGRMGNHDALFVVHVISAVLCLVLTVCLLTVARGTLDDSHWWHKYAGIGVSLLYIFPVAGIGVYQVFKWQ